MGGLFFIFGDKKRAFPVRAIAGAVPLHPDLRAQGPQGLDESAGTRTFDLFGYEKSNVRVFLFYAGIRLSFGNGFFSFIFGDKKRAFLVGKALFNIAS